MRKRVVTDKRCGKCKNTYPASGFYRDSNKADGLRALCRQCTIDIQGVGLGKGTNAVLRLSVIDKLGRRCVRCGFEDVRALQVDHVNEDGSHHRQIVTKNNVNRLYREMLADTFGRFQVLCANCNWIKRFERGNNGGKRRNHEPMPQPLPFVAQSARSARAEEIKKRTEKPCGKCKLVFPLEAFYEEKRRLDGRGSYCKPCAKASVRQSYNDARELDCHTTSIADSKARRAIA
jgi:hypothetical protein